MKSSTCAARLTMKKARVTPQWETRCVCDAWRARWRRARACAAQKAAGAPTTLTPRAPASQRDAVLARVLARYAALCTAERSYLARLPLGELQLLANGHASPADVFYAAAAALASPPRKAAPAAVADDDGFEITAVIEPADGPAWLARAKAALQSLLSDPTLAPRKTRDAALDALSRVITSALEGGEAAAGRAVYVDKLRAFVLRHNSAPASVKTEQDASALAKASRLSAAQASPHGGGAAAAGDDAAAARCVEVVCRVLTSAGWYHDTAGEENDGGQPRPRIMLLAGERELPALLARLGDITSALKKLRADAEKQAAAKRAAEPLMAALEALVIESDDDEDAAAAAWEERSAVDAAKVLAALRS